MLGMQHRQLLQRMLKPGGDHNKHLPYPYDFHQCLPMHTLFKSPFIIAEDIVTLLLWMIQELPRRTSVFFQCRDKLAVYVIDGRIV